MKSDNIFHWAVSNLFQWNNLRASFVGSLADRERVEFRRLHRKVLSAYKRSAFAHPDAQLDFTDQLVDEACRRARRLPSDLLRTALCELVWQLLGDEPVIMGMPDIPDLEHISLPHLIELRSLLKVKERVLGDPEFYVDVWREKIVRLIQGLIQHFPAVVFEGSSKETISLYAVPLIDVCSQAADAIERAMATMYDDDIVQAGLFANIRKCFEDNLARASGITESATPRTHVLTPTTSKNKVPDELVATFLSGTPFASFFTTNVPFQIPEVARFSHQWILAPQGAGKTQAIQTQILRDIERVANDKASIVVMDSQGDLIRNIAGLEMFAPGQPLADKLIVIEPDPEHPPALNIFDLGRNRQTDYTARDRERLNNSTLDLLTYVFGGLLGTEMTPKQSTLFRYTLRACMEIPDATILTFAELLQGDQKYRPYIDRMQGPVRTFFDTQFNDQKQFGQTKQEVSWRLMYMLENATFERMFSHPQSKIDFYVQLQSAKVILINTDRDLLKERTEIFGRFFIAMLLQASQERAALDRSNRLPVFCYIDECQDYIAEDTKITTLLDQARKMNIGLILANQRCAQMSAPVLDALCNVSIKMVRALSDTDAHTLARNMGSAADFLAAQPEQTFATSIRGITQNALSLKVPFFVLEDLPRMTERDAFRIRQDMYRQYCASPQLTHAPNEQMVPETEPPFNIEVDDLISTRPSYEDVDTDPKPWKPGGKV